MTLNVRWDVEHDQAWSKEKKIQGNFSVTVHKVHKLKKRFKELYVLNNNGLGCSLGKMYLNYILKVKTALRRDKWIDARLIK